MPSIPEDEFHNSLGAENSETRELSQTDHLNKKLLTYYLQRINSGSINITNDSTEMDENESKDEEWER